MRYAGALVHGSHRARRLFKLAVSSTTDRVRLGPAKRGHLVQDAARKTRLDLPATDTTGAKALSNDGLVTEEGVLDAGLPMVARRLLPSASPERFHVG